jgi:cyclopropane-fatty-acyl-phospholipid synthase
VRDIEVLRLHYAKTLQAWADPFEAKRDKAQAIYDERFCRMWEFDSSRRALHFPL